MDLRNLKHLDLSNNRISVINSYSFVNLPQIEILSLDHNQLELIDRDAFSKVTRLVGDVKKGKQSKTKQ